MPAYQYGGRDIEGIEITYSFGLSPGSATITLPGELSTSVGDEVALTFGGMNFHGIINANPVTQNNGTVTELQIVDNRIKLMWDCVFCTLNNVEVREDNPATPGIDRQKRYWHILPEDYAANIRTWTAAPYTASEVIDILLGAATVLHAWTTDKHAAQSKPVYSVDASNGPKLGTVLQDIGEQQGLVFTLVGENQLLWIRKGDGTPPTFPANSTDRRNGEALSNNDTYVTLVGDRNQYQDMPVDLEPDWNSLYQAYWIEPAWLHEVKTRFSMADATLADQAALVAFARKVTVRQYVAVRDATYADLGTWGEVGRMEIPVWVYLQDIVWKAYRIPTAYTVNGIDRANLLVNDGLLAAVTFNVDDGAMALKSPAEYYPDSKAFVIAKGQPLDLLDPRTQSAITLEQLNTARDKWSAQNRFNLDVKNYCVIFEHATFIPGADDDGLLAFPNRAVVPEGDPLYNIAVPNAAVTVAPAVVRAAVVFAAERYSKSYGSGVRRGSKYVGALNYHALMAAGVVSAEIPYADDKTVDEKAAEYAAAVIAQQPVYQNGGYTRHGSVGTVLSGVIDRVTISLHFDEALTEKVDFTKERAQSNFEHERDLDRKAKAKDLFPGQKNNRVDVERLELIAKLSRELKRVSPTGYRNMAHVMQTPVGAARASVSNVKVDGEAGQVVWVGGSFVGVIVAAGHPTGHLRAVATSGVVPVRVVAPFAAGDSVGCGSSVVAAGVGDAVVRGERVIGSVLSSYSGSGVVLVPVQIGSSTGLSERYGLQVYESEFTGEGDPPEDQGLRVKVRPGWIGQMVPTNNDNEFVVADNARTIVYYAVATDEGSTGALVSVEILTGSSLPTDPPGTTDHAPAVTYWPLATVIASGGVIIDILNDGRGSRTVRGVLVEVTCGSYTLAYVHGPASVAPDASSVGYADHEARISALESP